MQSLGEAPDLSTASGHRYDAKGLPFPQELWCLPPTTSGDEREEKTSHLSQTQCHTPGHCPLLPPTAAAVRARTHRRQPVGCAFAGLTIKQLSGYWEGIGAEQPRSESTRAVTPSCLPGCLSGLPPPSMSLYLLLGWR